MRYKHMYPAHPHTVLDTVSNEEFICADEDSARRLTEHLNNPPKVYTNALNTKGYVPDTRAHTMRNAA